ASGPSLNAPALVAVPATQPAGTLEIGSSKPSDREFPLALKIVPEGAGLTEVVLNDFKKTVEGSEVYSFQQPYEEFETLSRPLATRSITVNGVRVELSITPWTLANSSPDSATYSIDLAGPQGQVIARLQKSFSLFKRDQKDQGGGYDVLVTQTIQNLTDKPLEFSTTFNGPT